MIPLLASAPHSGVVAPRTAPEASDLFLFVVAALAVFVLRRSLRRRFRKRSDD